MTTLSTNELIDRFMESCSHDLRAPVASIKGLVQIAEHYPHTQEIDECLHMIYDSAEKMEKMLRSFQEFLVTSHYIKKAVEANCEELIDTVLEPFMSTIDRIGIKLVKNIQVADPWHIDRYSFSLILKHLVSNAITYQDPVKANKEISIHVLANQRYTILQVNDNGLGIPKELQPKLFQPFFRGHETSSGLGMGLFQVSKLVENAGGHLLFTSNEQEGTTFSVTIPAEKTANKTEQ
jgi:signal transduction histidine kinase